MRKPRDPLLKVVFVYQNDKTCVETGLEWKEERGPGLTLVRDTNTRRLLMGDLDL